MASAAAPQPRCARRRHSRRGFNTARTLRDPGARCQTADANGRLTLSPGECRSGWGEFLIRAATYPPPHGPQGRAPMTALTTAVQPFPLGLRARWGPLHGYGVATVLDRSPPRNLAPIRSKRKARLGQIASTETGRKSLRDVRCVLSAHFGSTFRKPLLYPSELRGQNGLAWELRAVRRTVALGISPHASYPKPLLCAMRSEESQHAGDVDWCTPNASRLEEHGEGPARHKEKSPVARTGLRVCGLMPGASSSASGSGLSQAGRERTAPACRALARRRC